jgi:hypothetical protein
MASGLFDRLKAGDSETIEVALWFLEVRPNFFRSGYHCKTILQRCKRASMSRVQAERFKILLEYYNNGVTKFRVGHFHVSQSQVKGTGFLGARSGGRAMGLIKFCRYAKVPLGR